MGAAYRLYLGFQSLRSALSTPKEGAAQASGHGIYTLVPLRAFCQGVINDLVNPKMAVFFASVLPQFAQPGQGMFSQLLVLGAVFAALTFVWLSLYSVVLGLAGKWLQRSSVRRAMDGMAGATLVALGIRVTTADR